MSERVRVAVVGPGLYWNKAHKGVLAGREDVEIVAFCASSERRKAEAASEFPDAPFYTDYDAFLAEVQCDAVLLLTPIGLTGRFVRQALEAGRHVVAEKPLSRSAADAFDLVGLAADKDRRLLVAEQAVYAPVVAKARDLLDDGRIGRPVSFDQAHHSIFDASHPDGYGKTWRADPDYPLGVLFDGGVHNLAVQAALFGRPTGVFASAVSLREGYGEYDHVLMQLFFASGVRATFSHAGYLGAQRNYFHIRGLDGLMQLDGDRLTVVDERGEQTLACPGDPREIMWARFCDCLRGVAEPTYSAEAAAGDVATLEAIAESCHTDRFVTPIQARRH